MVLSAKDLNDTLNFLTGAFWDLIHHPDPLKRLSKDDFSKRVSEGQDHGLITTI